MDRCSMCRAMRAMAAFDVHMLTTTLVNSFHRSCHRTKI